MARSKALRNAALALGAAAVAYGVTRTRQADRASETFSVPPAPVSSDKDITPSALEPFPAPGWQRRLGIAAIALGVILLIAAAIVTWGSSKSTGTSSNPSVAVPIQVRDKA
ncbi:MAG TPA: hypothetical protein VN108_10640, partial [Marmoricola sp.]|nr:hypothetical protein [Marmoricola sp.]